MGGLEGRINMAQLHLRLVVRKLASAVPAVALLCQTRTLLQRA